MATDETWQDFVGINVVKKKVNLMGNGNNESLCYLVRMIS